MRCDTPGTPVQDPRRTHTSASRLKNKLSPVLEDVQVVEHRRTIGHLHVLLC
jgi:hypothetical protein